MPKLIVFIFSFLFALIFLQLERLFGIQWNYHPDAETYIYESQSVVIELLENGYLGLFNNFYYVIAFILKSNINFLIILNMLAFSFSNVLIYLELSNYYEIQEKSKNRIFWLSLSVLFLIPYRIHLSVHVLKDSLIILCLIMIVSGGLKKYFGFLFILLIRVFSFFYFIILVNKKYYKYIIFFIVLIFIIFNNQIIEYLVDKNDQEMTFREFDKVPTFSDLGISGTFIRAILWPILVFSGIFIFISPSFSLLPIAIGSIIIQYWCLKFLKKIGFTIGVYFSSAIIALFVNGFTSYIRYTFPLIIVLPILIIKQEKQKEIEKNI